MKFNELSHMMQKPEPKPDTYEAGMALNQLLKIGTHAIKIHNMIDDGAEMEAWVAKKIDLASNYVKSVHGYTAGSKAGTYDDDGMSEMKKMPKGTGTMQGVKEDAGEKFVVTYKGIQKANDEDSALDILQDNGYDIERNPDGTFLVSYQGVQKADNIYDVLDILRDEGYDVQIEDDEESSDSWYKYGYEGEFSEDAGEQALANELSTYYQDAADGMDPEDHGNDEHDDYLEIAQGFKKGLQAGMDQVNMSGWEFSTNDFDMNRDGKGTMYEPMAELLKKYNVSASLNKKGEAFLIKSGKAITDPGHWDTSKSVSEDAGEGHMSKSQLYQTAKMAIELLDMIRKGDDLEGWVQTKLNLAADYLQAVYHYEDYQKLNPYREELDSNVLQRHAGIIQKHLDEILERKCRTEDVDTKPGMMRILKKRVNEVEKEIAKENRKESQETTEAIELEEGIKEWGKRLAMAGVIVAGLAGVNSINNAIDNSIPAVKAMNTALEMAQDSGNTELAKMIEKDLSDAKVRLTSGKDLSHVADLQDKYAKFMKTEGLAYESKLAVNLKQRLK